jgi:hypothetical protein
MAIKNKDGSTYCFSKPNPLMNSQALWPKDEKVIFHNKFGKRYSDNKLAVEEAQEEVEEVVEEKVEIVEKIIEKGHSLGRDEYVFDVWCLPATVINKVDPLYGSNYSRIKYGEKYKFEAKLYESNDLHLQLITKQEIPVNSVIFPLNKDRRWWRVAVNKTYEAGFWLVTGQISDYQPNFS